MNTTILIIKAIVFYTTVIAVTLLIVSIDVIEYNGYVFECFSITAILLVVCYNSVTWKDIERISPERLLNKWL